MSTIEIKREHFQYAEQTEEFAARIEQMLHLDEQDWDETEEAYDAKEGGEELNFVSMRFVDNSETHLFMTNVKGVEDLLNTFFITAEQNAELMGSGEEPVSHWWRGKDGVFEVVLLGHRNVSNVLRYFMTVLIRPPVLEPENCPCCVNNCNQN